MAQTVIVLKTCDLVHDEDNVEATDSVRFGFDGYDYELDLCSLHSTEVRHQLQELASHSRRTASLGRGRRRTGASDRAGRQGGRESLAAVRTWARSNGFEVSDRGRLPRNVIDAYRAAAG